MIWRGLRIAALTVAVFTAFPAAPLDPVTLGARLFDGSGDVGAKALLGGTARMPATRFACRGCHGRDGAGGREAAAPPIRKVDLFRATPRRPAYDDATLRRVLEEGITPDGRPLGNIMPRYILDEDVFRSLALYLERLPEFAARGILPDRVTLGVLVPPDNAATARRYAGLLAREIAGSLPAGRIHGRQVVVETIDGAPADMLERATRETAAVIGLLPSAGVTVAALTERQVPVLFPLFPLDGGEDPTIVKGLMADRDDALRALADRAAADGMTRLLLSDIAACGASAEDFTRRFARPGVKYEIVRLPLPVDFSIEADEAYLLLCRNRRASHAALDSLRGGVTIYGLATDLLFETSAGARKRRVILATEQMPLMAEGDGAAPMLEKHAARAARLLIAALSDARRGLSRASLLTAVGRQQSADMGLDFIRDPLNGTTQVGFIEIQAQ